MRLRILSLIPPLVQVNTPYPATSFLTGFLRERGYQESYQDDLGLKLILKVMSRSGLEKVRAILSEKQQSATSTLTESELFFLDAYSDYARTIDSVIEFLQGKNASLAHRIASRTLLPEGPRFTNLDENDLIWAFGGMGTHDQAKHIASLYIDDLTDVIREGVDADFSLSRYADRLAASQASFDPLYARIMGSNGLIYEFLKEITLQTLREHQPEVVLLTVPFPGCVLGAFQIARLIKLESPTTRIVLGGGYVNTELRKLKDARVFEFVDAITLDDGERPLELLLEYFLGKRQRGELLRTFLLAEKVNHTVEFCSSAIEHDLPQIATGHPTLDGLPMNQYLSLVEMLNPMHRFWSDLHWNKLMLAHGCYWHKCSFCDISLDYIKRYEVSPIELTLKRMERLAKESGTTGFHFIDEAAPPAVLKELSFELVKRGLNYSWWGNIRFEKSFNATLTDLMSDAGCVAVSGGLEVASDRLLKKMKKGVTVEQVARVTKNFRNSKVLVHAYLMYGFPTQTLQETIDSLERVRQLFSAGCLSSAFWHRFSTTAHSEVGMAPQEFGVKILSNREVQFSENDLEFMDSSSAELRVDHDRLGPGLKKAVYNYMLGIGLDEDVRSWFSFKVPKPQVDPDLIQKALD